MTDAAVQLPAVPAVTRPARRRTRRVERLLRWEFWPASVVYAPLWPFIALCAVRHRGITSCGACNTHPALRVLVGESKSAILGALPAERTISSALIRPANSESRTRTLVSIMRERSWSWPLVLKPDSGERGAGVRLIQSDAGALEYFRLFDDPVLVQPYDPGPFEAGIFYIRPPGSPRGRIFSITDKVFAVVTGDGARSVAELVHDHPRYRLQADVHLRRLGSDAARVPCSGESVAICMAGNHCQGTMFLDGAGLITPDLESAIDDIAQRVPGFHFGRFDVRYSDPAELRAGRGFRIVELNGLFSESTNIYDPSFTFWSAQRTLRRQWEWAYRIGAANIAAGAPRPTLREAVSLLRARNRWSREQQTSD